ncbi:MAG TPA: glycosyltransferase [Vicinamibacterales bacterium]|jgi:glycosyltransferase involved in cell wall biosynthesis|nr:glycosyltransferase [Vicinamibacterales bacterium]
MPQPFDRPAIAHLIESDGPGGAERIVAALARALQESGTRNVVYLPADGEGWLARELAGSGVIVERYRLDQPLSPACARSIAASFARHRIDLAHSHEFTMAVYGAWAAWYAGVPSVITMHGSRYYAGRLQRRLALRAAMAGRTRVVAVSHRLAGHIRRDLLVPRSRIEMVPNGVPFTTPGAADTLRRELSLGPGDRLLVAVGNLYPVKGHRIAVDALVRLAGAHPGLHLAIAGRGELEDALKDEARGLGLDGRVHLLGLRSDVSAVLAAADVFVLPSLAEGLPLALLEAMFAGRPIVATDVGEVRAALDDGDAGLVVPPGDAAALASAIEWLLIDPDKARILATRARARAIAEYDVRSMVRRYRSIYDTLLTGAVSPVLQRTPVTHPPRP